MESLIADFVQFLFLQRRLDMGYVYDQFWGIPEISSFPKIPNLMSFDSSCGNSYIQLLVILI